MRWAGPCAESSTTCPDAPRRGIGAHSPVRARVPPGGEHARQIRRQRIRRRLTAPLNHELLSLCSSLHARKSNQRRSCSIRSSRWRVHPAMRRWPQPVAGGQWFRSGLAEERSGAGRVPWLRRCSVSPFPSLRTEPDCRRDAGSRSEPAHVSYAGCTIFRIGRLTTGAGCLRGRPDDIRTHARRHTLHIRRPAHAAGAGDAVPLRRRAGRARGGSRGGAGGGADGAGRPAAARRSLPRRWCPTRTTRSPG